MTTLISSITQQIDSYATIEAPVMAIDYPIESSWDFTAQQTNKRQ